MQTFSEQEWRPVITSAVFHSRPPSFVVPALPVIILGHLGIYTHACFRHGCVQVESVADVGSRCPLTLSYFFLEALGDCRATAQGNFPICLSRCYYSFFVAWTASTQGKGGGDCSSHLLTLTLLPCPHDSVFTILSFLSFSYSIHVGTVNFFLPQAYHRAFPPWFPGLQISTRL